MKQLTSLRLWRSVLAFVLALMVPFNAVAGTLKLPAAVTVIEEKAFLNNKSLSRVVLPESLTTIESQAFKGATALETVVIPSGVTDIANDAFEGVDGLVIETTRGSYAWNWAVEREYQVYDPADAECNLVSFAEKTTTLYANGNLDSAWIGWISYDGLLSDPTLAADKLSNYALEKLSGDCVELAFDSAYANEVWASNITGTGESVWRVSADLSDGSKWSENITVTVINLPDDAANGLVCEPMQAVAGAPFEFSWDLVSLNGELPETDSEISKEFRLHDREADREATRTENGFIFTPASAGEYGLTLTYCVANYEIKLETAISVVEKPAIDFGRNLVDTVYASGTADNFLLGPVTLDMDLAEDETLEWSIEIVESSTETPAAQIGFNAILANGCIAVLGLKELTGETGTVTYALTVQHGDLTYVYDYTLNVIEAPDTLPAAITVPADSCQLAVGETLSLYPADIRFVGGTVPSDLSGQYTYEWDKEETGLSIKNGNPIQITAVENGVYTIQAYAAILNRVYRLPITIVVADPETESDHVSFVQNTHTLYVEGTYMPLIGWVSYDGQKADPTLATGKLSNYRLEKISGDDCVELYFDGTYVNEIWADNFTSPGTAEWCVYADLSDGSTWSCPITISVAHMPDNFPTGLCYPDQTITLGDTFTFNWDDVTFDGEQPDDGNQVSGRGFILLDPNGENIIRKVTKNDDGFTYVPDQLGEYKLEINNIFGNVRLSRTATITVTDGEVAELDVFHYFKTLYLEGNVDEVDIAEINVDTVLEDGESIEYDVEYVSGDADINLWIAGISKAGTTAYVVVNDIEGLGQSTWCVSATLPDGTVQEKEITVDVVNMPKDFPTELIVEYPMRGNVGEYFLFKPSEHVQLNGTLADDGNVKFCNTAIYGEIINHPTYEEIDDGHHSAFAFTPDKDMRYGISLYYYLGNHCLENHGIIIIGDGNSEIGVVDLNVMDTIYIDAREDHQTYWFGNAVLNRFHTLPNEEIGWKLEVVEHSGDDPAVMIELTDTFENTHGINMDVVGQNGELGFVTYRITASWDRSSWFEEFTVEVVEPAENLPTEIAVPETYFEVDVGDTLDFYYDDIEFVDGELPEGVKIRYDYWNTELLQEEQEFEWMEGYISVHFVREGRYRIDAIAQIGNKEYVLPIYIVVGRGVSNDAVLQVDKLMPVAYAGQPDEVHAMLAQVFDFVLLEGESYEWTLEKTSAGKAPLRLYINNQFDGGRGVNLHATNFSNATGSVDYRLTVRVGEHFEKSYDFTIEVVELPENLPTTLEVEDVVTLEVGETYAFHYDDVRLADGEVPEGVEPRGDAHNVDQLEWAGDFDWTDDGFVVSFNEEGVYRFDAVVSIANYVLRKPVTIYVGGVEENFIYSVNKIDPIYTSLGGNWTPLDELETVFYGSDNAQLRDEEIEWNVEILSGEDLMEIYIDGEENRTWLNLSARNISSETGTVEYQVTATLQNGLSYTYTNSVTVMDEPEDLPTHVTVEESVYYVEVGERFEFQHNWVGTEGGVIPEGAFTRVECDLPSEILDRNDFESSDNGFAVSFDREGRYGFNVGYRIGTYYPESKRVVVVVGSGLTGEEWFNAQQEKSEIFAIVGAEPFIGSFDVQNYELLDGESYEWTLEKISDENEAPCALEIDSYYEDGRGLNIRAVDLTGETGSVTYLLTVTTESGLAMSHEIHVEVVPGRDDLPTAISVPKNHIRVLAGNVIVLKRSDINFADGVVLDGDDIWADYWNLECLGDQACDWDGENGDNLVMHLTEIGTYKITAVKSINGLNFYDTITLEVVEPTESDPYVDWQHVIHTVYTDVEEPSTWIGWAVLENYEVTDENEVFWTLERVDWEESNPVDVYIETFNHVHTDIRYANPGHAGSVIYRLTVETSDGFMDSREYVLHVEDLPHNLPTAIDMQTVYELEAGETFEFDVSEAVFADGEIPDGASQRYHVRGSEMFREMDGFEWTENGFRVPMMQEGRYQFTYGMQIGNYTVSQDILVLVGSAYPEDAAIQLFLPNETIFNDTNISDAWLGYVVLENYDLYDGETIDWQIERIDENEVKPAVIAFGQNWGNGYSLHASEFSSETGDIDLRVTANTSMGFSISKDFTVHVIETPDNMPTGITVEQDHVELAADGFYAFYDEDVIIEGGEIPEGFEPYYQSWVDEDLYEHPGFEWVGDIGFEIQFAENGRHRFTAVMYIGSYEYTKDVYLYVGEGHSDDTRVEWEQPITTVYTGVEQPNDWIGAAELMDYPVYDENSVNWMLERIDESEGSPVELVLNEVTETRVEVCAIHAEYPGSVTYRLTAITDSGYTESRDYTVTVEELPENLPTELAMETVYWLPEGETFIFDASAIEFADGEVPENADIHSYYHELEALEQHESFNWTENGFEVTLNESNRYSFVYGLQIGNHMVEQRVHVLVGNGNAQDARLEVYGEERQLFVGMDLYSWAFDASLRDYLPLPEEGIHWDLIHVDGLTLDVYEEGRDGENVWYNVGYTGDKTGDAVFRLLVHTDNGFFASRLITIHIVDWVEGLPTDMVIPAEDVYLQVGDSYAARYEDMSLTDDGEVPEDADVRCELHVPDSLMNYRNFEWTDEGFEVTFEEDGRYRYHAVIKVNGLEYHKEVRMIVGNGMSDDAALRFEYGFEGRHYIGDNTQWVADLALDGYNPFDDEEISWNVECHDEEELANLFVDPVWNDGLNAAIFMDDFSGRTGIGHYTVTVETAGGFSDSFDFEVEFMEIPELFPEYIEIAEDVVHLNVGDTYHARLEDFWWFNEGSVIPENASWGAEFWPDELEEYHGFEWVEGGFDVTFHENGRYHYHVNAAINGVDFTREVRIYVGKGVEDGTWLEFEPVFTQHYINDQTQWIGDAHLHNYTLFDGEEVHWEIEYLDEGEPLAHVFIDPVWDDGLSAGIRVNDFRGTGAMNMRLHVYTDDNFYWSSDFYIELHEMPSNLPSGIEVDEEEIYLEVGETYEARIDNFAWFRHDGEIDHENVEMFHEFYVDEELRNYYGFAWVDGGFNVTFDQSCRHNFHVAVTVNGVEYVKEIRLIVGEGVHEDAHMDIYQEIFTAYATTEENDAWIGWAELDPYRVFDNEHVEWWVEPLNGNDALEAYVNNVWDDRSGANIHVNNFTGETGMQDYRVHAETEYGHHFSADFSIEIVEQPDNLPTELCLPQEEYFFNVEDEFVIRDNELAVSGGVVPEDATLRFEYHDPEGVFHDQEMYWNEGESGFTVRFHREGRYELFISAVINTYRITRSIRITVGDGVNEEMHLDVWHAIDPVYTGVEGSAWMGNAYVRDYNLFEGESIEWSIKPVNEDEPSVADVWLSSSWDNTLGVNYDVANVAFTGESSYIIKAVLPTGEELQGELTVHAQELPEGLPTELVMEQDEYVFSIGDTFTLFNREIRFGEGELPQDAAYHADLWPDDELEAGGMVERINADNRDDEGISITFEYAGEFRVSAVKWIGNYQLVKQIRLTVTEPWKMAVLVGSEEQSSEEYSAAQKLLATYGEDHVLIETFDDNFDTAAEETAGKIAAFAERAAVKAIIVAPSVPGTVDGFRQAREIRDDVMLISSMPMEPLEDVAEMSDVMFYSNEADQAHTIIDTLEAWNVDVLVHYSFERHMANDAIAARYNILAERAAEAGIALVNATMPDPADNFDAAISFIDENVDELCAEYADQKVAFFATNCGVQGMLQSAVLHNENAYYPQPCCPSPYHGFGELLSENLDELSPKAALRKIGNFLAEHNATGRFATASMPLNMGVLEVAGRYAAAYAEEGLSGKLDDGAVRQMMNARFGSVNVSNHEYDNGYAITLGVVDFGDYTEASEAEIAVLTGSMQQGYEEYTAAAKLLETYGEHRVTFETYSDDFASEEGIEQTISQIVAFAEDPNVSAIIVSQAVPGTLEGFRQVRGMRDDVMLIAGLPQEDMQDMSDVADLMLLTDEAAQAVPIMDSCENWGVEVFVHYSFERHLNNGPVMARRNNLAEKCVELGIEFVEIDIPDPAMDGYDEMVNFIGPSVAQVMAEHEGKKVAFFSTNCGSQAALQNAVLCYDNAYYPQPCCPSPFHGFAESLEIELDMTGNPRNALRQIANALAEYDAVDRFSTGAESINMAFIELAGEYALAYADGEIGLGADDGMIRQMINARLSNALIDNSIFHNGYMVVSAPVDFGQYVGVHAGKVAILTGSLNQGEEEYTAAMLAVERHGDDRVIVETYADNFYENTEQTAAQIAAFAEDPNVSAIVVAQAVPGTLEGFRRVREMRSDVLLIAGMAQEDHFEMSDVADVMLFSEEPRQAGPIMDKCVEWGVDAIVHYSFERHMSLELVKARHDEMKAFAERQEIEFIDITMPDPTVAGVQQARAFITENVPAVLTEYEGKKVAFFSTNCGVQAALQSAVIANENAYYPQPCCPSPTHGFQESLNLDLPLNDSAAAIRMVANALYEKGVIDRVSTGAVAINMAIIEVAVDYAIDYADGVVKNRNDEEIIFEMIDRSMNNPIADNDVHGNVYAITLRGENMMDYVTTDDVIQLWVSEGVMDFTADQLETFQQENPEYDDLRIHLKSVNEADVSDKLLRRAEFGADVFGLPHDQVFELYVNDMLSPLTEENAQLVTENNDAGSVAAATMVNELYAYPMTSDNGYFMYYDKSIISDQMTLEEILAACEENDRTFHMELNSGWYQVAFFFGAGCELYFDTNANGEFTLCHANYASDNGVKALKSMIKVASSPAFRNDTAIELLGDMGAFVSGTWAAVDVQELLGDNYAAMKLPTVDGYQMSAFSGYKMMGVKPQSSDHRQAACDALAMYLTSEDVQAARFEAVEWGPSNLNAQNTEALQNSEAHSALAAQMQYSVAQGQYPGEYWDLSFELGERVMSGSLNDKSDEELMEVLTQFQDEVSWVVIPQT